VGVCREKEESAPGIASPLMRRDWGRQGLAHGRSREPLWDTKEREQRRDTDAMLRYTVTPVFSRASHDYTVDPM
jgi:hypothetical protein